MIRVDVRSPLNSVIAEFKATTDAIKDKATVRALNRALDQTATATSREIRKEYNVTHRAVLKALKKRRANSRSLHAKIEMRGSKLPLIAFSARAVNPWNVAGRKRRLGGGVSVQVKVAGGRKVVRGAFIATGTANNATGGGSEGMRQVWRRAGPGRYPILNLRSVSVPQAFANKAVIAAVSAIAADSFKKNFAQQIQFLGVK